MQWQPSLRLQTDGLWIQFHSGDNSSSHRGKKQKAAAAPLRRQKRTGKTYNAGICQLVQHPAFDAATEGFEAALKDKPGDNVKFDLQNASGDSATCAMIINQFVSTMLI